MAVVIIPKRGCLDIGESYEIDFDNPICRGMAQCVISSRGVPRQIYGRGMSRYGTLGTYANKYGVGVTNNGESVSAGNASNYIELPVTGSAVTVLYVGGRLSTPGASKVSEGVATQAGSETAGFALDLGNAYGNANLLYFYAFGSGAGYKVYVDGAPTIGNNPTNFTIVNGNTYSIVASMSSHTAGTGHTLLAKASGINDYAHDSFFNLYAQWDRQLTEYEHKSLSANPRQILKPRRKILYFGGAIGPTHTLTAATSNYTTTFNAATLKVSRLLTAATASYATTFQATTLKVSRLLTANTAAYTTVFSAAGLLASRLLTAGMAVYTTTFTAALLLVHRLIAAGTASYTTTVNAANLIYTPIGGATYTLMAEGAAYATTFSAAQLLVSRRLVADAAVYTTAFRPAQLTIGVVSNNSWTPVSGLQSPWGAVSARAPTWTQGVALSTGLWS